MPEKLRIGNAEIAVARDADFRFAPAGFLPSVPPSAWKPYLGDADPAEVAESRVLTFVIRSQGRNILVDSGVGQWGLWRFGDGHLLDSLRELDLTPESIDFVLPTHLHADHVGWNTKPSANGPVPTFPRARYLFQKLDWDHFTAPVYLENPASGNGARMMEVAVLPLKDTGLMDLIDSERAITDEVTLLHTPGHTPGSVTILVQSAGEAALLIGDAAHHAAQLSEPEWSPAIDIDPSLSARSRKGIVEQAQRLNAYVAGAHFTEPHPAFGRILPIEGRMIWQGVALP
jgi:glyoxylase-like metal-dependent hydrolase (beta-lactamase superfamily II)